MDGVGESCQCANRERVADMLKADDFRHDQKEVAGWPVNITSYRIGSKYYCHIDNVDPGATIVRTEGDSYDEVLRQALNRAQERLKSRA